jgi:hypothetical protein
MDIYYDDRPSQRTMYMQIKALEHIQEATPVHARYESNSPLPALQQALASYKAKATKRVGLCLIH